MNAHLAGHYVHLARSANRIALLITRLEGDGGEFWRKTRDRYLALARQMRSIV